MEIVEAGRLLKDEFMFSAFMLPFLVIIEPMFVNLNCMV